VRLSRPLLALAVVFGQPGRIDRLGDLVSQSGADLVGDSRVGILAQLGRDAGDASRLGRVDHDLTGGAIGGADRVEFVVPGHGGVADPQGKVHPHFVGLEHGRSLERDRLGLNGQVDQLAVIGRCPRISGIRVLKCHCVVLSDKKGTPRGAVGID
jgi:hypothetical protein